MSDRLKDKVALVSSRLKWPRLGNGKATAVIFAREGAKILIADINLDAASRPSRSLRLRVASARPSPGTRPVPMTSLR